MSIPGFTAEAALHTSGGRQRGTCNHGIGKSENIAPADVKGTYTIVAGHDPDEYCIYRECTLTTYTGPPYAQTTCTANWVCGHRSL